MRLRHERTHFNFKVRKKLKICLIEPTIEALERGTIMEPISFTNTPGTPITIENFKKVSLSAKPITTHLVVVERLRDMWTKKNKCFENPKKLARHTCKMIYKSFV